MTRARKPAKAARPLRAQPAKWRTLLVFLSSIRVPSVRPGRKAEREEAARARREKAASRSLNNER